MDDSCAQEVMLFKEGQFEEMNAGSEVAAAKEAGEAVVVENAGPKLEIAFATNDEGVRKVVTVTSGNLGVVYSAWNGEVTIVREGGYGEECGIKVGWRVVGID